MRNAVVAPALLWFLCITSGSGFPLSQQESSYVDTASIWAALNSNPHLAIVDNDSLIKVYEQTYLASVKLNYQFGRFMSSYDLGFMYGLKLNETLSMQYWQKALDIASEDKLYEKWLGDIYLTIAGQYAMSDPGGKCLHWLNISRSYLQRRADRYSEKQLSDVNLWDLNTRYANAYFKTGQFTAGDRCLAYLLKNLTPENTLRNIDVDVVRYNKAVNSGRFEDALKFAERIIKNVQQMDGGPRRKAGFYLFLPKVYAGIKNYPTALAYIDSARLDRRYQTQPNIKMFVDRQEIDIYEQSGQLHKAVSAMRRLENYKDSLFRHNDMTAASHHRTELELDNYVRELAIEEANSKSKTIINLLLVAVALLIISIIYTRYKKFLGSLQKTHQFEKIEVGNDIHDVINPGLTYVRMRILNLSANTHYSPESLRELVPILDTSILNVRQLASWIRTSAEIDSFSELFDQMLEKYSNAYALTLEKVLKIQDPMLSPGAKSTLYFVAQELLLNTWKHADANKCFVSLTQKSGVVYLVYSDNGKGFSGLVFDKGVGLASIRNRVERIGGTVEFDSTPDIAYSYKLTVQIPSA